MYQIRLPGDDRFFSPNRDLAWQGPHLIATALQSLQDPQFHEPWLLDILEKYEVTAEELEDGMTRFLKIVNAVIDTYDPAQAIEQTGFDSVSPAVQSVIYTRLGQILLAAYYTGVKETRTPEDCAPPETLALNAAELVAGLQVRLLPPTASGSTVSDSDNNPCTNPSV